MYLSLKYVILYTGAGLATGYLSKGDKTAALVGMGLAALAGSDFGVSYAILSLVEFGAGFGLSLMFGSGTKSG
jgi:hypothetical protein